MKVVDRASLRRGGWASTRWTLVAGLAESSEPERQASWSYLVDTYRPAMERYVRSVLTRRRSRPASAEEAAEVVQDFLVTCVEKDWLRKADPLLGRFRAFIQTLLLRFTLHRLRSARALRRSPGEGKRVFSLLEADAAEEVTALDRAELAEFDRMWIKIAIERAVQRLGKHNDRYQLVIIDLMATDGEGSSDLPAQTGLRHEQFPVLKLRARKRFAKLLREELVSTVRDPGAYAEELKALERYIP